MRGAVEGVLTGHEKVGRIEVAGRTALRALGLGSGCRSRHPPILRAVSTGRRTQGVKPSSSRVRPSQKGLTVDGTEQRKLPRLIGNGNEHGERVSS